MVTQKQIARELGVTQQAVSYALTGGGTLSLGMRERIITAATEFGYRPNGVARAMKSGRFGSVALLMGKGENSSTLPDQLWSGIHNELALHNLHLVMARLPDDALSDTAALPKILREMSVDGVLLDYTHQIPPRLRESLEASQLPAVWLNTKRPFDCVHPDDFGAGVTLLEYLSGLGHRRIAYVDVAANPHDPHVHYSVADRRAGVQQAAKRVGIAIETLSLGENTVAEQLRMMRALWERPQPVTAVIGYSEDAFEMVCRAAWESGRRVPDDVSVAVFADFRAKRLFGFDLTYMKVPQELEGREAVRLLLKKISGDRSPAPPRLVPFNLLTGQTVVAPQKE